MGAALLTAGAGETGAGVAATCTGTDTAGAAAGFGAVATAGFAEAVGITGAAAGAAEARMKPVRFLAKVADGRVKSGEPFALVSGLAVPYDATDGSGSGPAATLAGFLFTDQTVTSTRGNVTAPAIWHGRIILSKLPSTVTAAAKTSGLFVWEA